MKAKLSDGPRCGLVLDSQTMYPSELPDTVSVPFRCAGCDDPDCKGFGVHKYRISWDLGTGTYLEKVYT